MTALLPSEVLTKAADLIEPDGAWTRDAFWRLPDGTTHEEALDYGVEDPAPSCFCLFGAIAAVNGEIDNPEANDTRPYERFLFKAIDMSPALPRALSAWNDEEGRTQAEVVAALRQASDLAKAEGQ